MADDNTETDEADVRRSAEPVHFSRVWALDDIEILRAGQGGDGRTVAAYAAVFGQRAEIRDVHGHYYEQIHRSAFRRALSHGDVSRRVTVLYNHGFDLAGNPSGLGSVPIGSPVEVRDDQRGLYTVTRYNRSELADAVLAAIENGDIRGYSFRGRVYQSDPPRMPRSRSGELPTITRMELGLSEYGPTPIPFYADAGIVAIRSALPQLQALPQRQRIEIARALLADEPADEPETTDSTPEPDEPDATEAEGTDTSTTPEPESEQDADVEDPDDDSPTADEESAEDDESTPGTEDSPDEGTPAGDSEAARSRAADVRRQAATWRITRGGK